MSSAMLKRTLELFNDDLEDAKKNKVTERRIKSKNEKVNKLKLKKKQKQTELQQKCTKDKTEESLKLLQRLSEVSTTDRQTTETILKYNKGRLSKYEEKMEPEDTSTVFSAADFNKFEKEYDFFS